MSRQLSENLSKTIIAEAIKQVRQISGFSRLLVMLADQRRGELELVCRCRRWRRPASPDSDASSSKRQLSSPTGPKSADKQETPDDDEDDKRCPLCNGNGALDLSGEDVIRLKLAQTNGNNNNNNNNDQEQRIAPVSGGGPNAAGQLSASNTGQQLLSGARSQLANRLVEWLDANVAPLKALEQTRTLQSALTESSPSLRGIGGGQDLLPAEGAEDVALDQVRRNYGHRRRQSIEQLLVELRDEQRALAEQTEALRLAKCRLEQQQQQQAAAVAAASPPNRRHASAGNRPDLAAKSPTSAGPCRPAQQAVGGRELSSSIQRMKRMDTLKRRKLEKEKRLSQEAGQPLNRLPETTSLGSIRFAKPLTESILSGLATASDASIAEAEEAEDDDDYEDEHEVGRPRRVGRKPGRLRRQQGSLNEGRFGDGDTTDDDPYCPVKAGAERPAPSGGQSARLRQVVAGDTRETGAAPPAAKGAAPGQQASEPGRASSAYSYQGLRSSLASLVDEVSEQSRKRKFANLNPFANKSIVAALSSLGSPIKRASQKSNNPARKEPKETNVQTPTRSQGNGEKQTQPPASAATHKTEPRKPSSRSQSSGSAGATPSSPRPAGNRIASNCPNCLKSSASSQSVNSLNDEHHQHESLK